MSSRVSWKKRKLVNPTFIPQERRGSMILACVLFWSVLFFFGINRYVLGSVEVVGSSMVPTLAHGERHLLNRWLYRVIPPKRGDIVVIDDPESGSESIKRIVGLPGERIEFRRGVILLNGRQLAEPYLPRGMPTFPLCERDRALRVPADHYFVLGDNRPVSADSRTYGSISRHAILGVVDDFGA